MVRQLAAVVHRRLNPVGYARSIGVTVGEDCRLIDVSFSTEPYLVHLGNHVSATKTHFETHDGGVWVIRHKHPEIDVVRPIHVGDNVYFGYGCLVMPGATIGNNVVVGAGSVVAGTIPDNSVVGGVPARVIKSVAEYETAALAKSSPTKGWTLDEKQVYYTRIFGRR
ncbi:capsule biosynthesis protein CapG [Mycolicibacterium sp. P9-22]|nr:capsule biosynthesis protein CapG [Mycolicibacterium sp. P9-22]